MSISKQFYPNRAFRQTSGSRDVREAQAAVFWARCPEQTFCISTDSARHAPFAK